MNKISSPNCIYILWDYSLVFSGLVIKSLGTLNLSAKRGNDLNIQNEIQNSLLLKDLILVAMILHLSALILQLRVSDINMGYYVIRVTIWIPYEPS